jgi:hypothetical protein
LSEQQFWFLQGTCFSPRFRTCVATLRSAGCEGTFIPAIELDKLGAPGLPVFLGFFVALNADQLINSAEWTLLLP